MRELVLALGVVVLVVGLAGCLGADSDPLEESQAPANASTTDTSDPLERFRNGEALDEPRPDLPRPNASTVLTGFHGAEPSIGTLPTGEIFVQSFDETLRSTDGGQTWEVVHDFQSLTGGGSSDPMLWIDRSTERVYWNHMAPTLVCTAVGWSGDAGETWERNDAACGLPGVDFQKLGGGPPGPDPNPLAGEQHPSVLYLCYNKPGVAVCAPSYDGGESWPIEVPITCGAGTSGPSVACPLIRAPPEVGPDGTAYVPVGGILGAGCPSLVAKSTDSGLTWTPTAGPTGSPCVSIDDLDVAPDGTLYVAGEGSQGYATYLARSTDGGQTWEGPWRVTPPDVQSVAFQAVTAGEDGRVGVALVGTEDTDAYPGNAPDDARWHLHMVTTEDARADEPIFTSVQATDDPVQVGAICGAGILCDTPAFKGGRNLLDFIDATVHPDGTFYATYTDGCIETCANATDPAPDHSREDATAVAWLDGVSLADSEARPGRKASSAIPPLDAGRLG